MEETPRVAEGLTDETPQTAEAPMDETSQTEEVLAAETLQAGEARTDETSQAAEAPMDETSQTGEGLTDETAQVSEIPMDESFQTSTRRFNLRDAVPFALVILVTVAVIAFIVAAPSAHAETSTAQGNEYIQQTVAYVDRSATLYPAVCSAEPSGIADTGEVCSWSQDAVGNAVDYEVTVKNSGFGSPACFRTVIALECTPDGEALTFLNANTSDFAWRKVESSIEVDGTKYAVYVATYGKGLPAGDSVNVMSQIAMDPEVLNSDLAPLGEKYSIMVTTQAVRYEEGFNPTGLLDSAFGEITATNHPWSGNSSQSEQPEQPSQSESVPDSTPEA